MWNCETYNQLVLLFLQAELTSSSLKGCINALNHELGHDDMCKTFWTLMTCFCLRRILDFIENADVKGFSAFMAQAFTRCNATLEHTVHGSTSKSAHLPLSR